MGGLRPPMRLDAMVSCPSEVLRSVEYDFRGLAACRVTSGGKLISRKNRFASAALEAMAGEGGG